MILSLGALSYPLYLIHNLAGKAVIKEMSQIIDENLTKCIIIVIMIILSFLIHFVMDNYVLLYIRRILYVGSDGKNKILSTC